MLHNERYQCSPRYNFSSVLNFSSFEVGRNSNPVDLVEERKAIVAELVDIFCTKAYNKLVKVFVQESRQSTYLCSEPSSSPAERNGLLLGKTGCAMVVVPVPQYR